MKKLYLIFAFIFALSITSETSAQRLKLVNKASQKKAFAFSTKTKKYAQIANIIYNNKQKTIQKTAIGIRKNNSAELKQILNAGSAVKKNSPI